MASAGSALSSVFFDAHKFSYRNFPINTVIRKFAQCLMNKTPEECVHWATEMHMSGFHAEFWDVCFLFIASRACKNLPMFPIFLHQQWTAYLQVIENISKYSRGVSEVTGVTSRDVTNNGKTSFQTASSLEKSYRDVWVETICGCVNVEHNEMILLPRADPEITGKIIERAAEIQKTPGPRNNWMHFWLRNSPEAQGDASQNTILALASIFCKALEAENFQTTLAVVSALLDYDVSSKKISGRPLQGLSRNGIPSYSNYKQWLQGPLASKSPGTSVARDWIWILWEALLEKTLQNGQKFRIQAVAALQNMFSLGYTSLTKRKERLPFLLTAILLSMNRTINVHRFAGPYTKRHVLSRDTFDMVNAAQRNIGSMYDEIHSAAIQIRGQGISIGQQQFSHITSSASAAVNDQLVEQTIAKNPELMMKRNSLQNNVANNNNNNINNINNNNNGTVNSGNSKERPSTVNGCGSSNKVTKGSTKEGQKSSIDECSIPGRLSSGAKLRIMKSIDPYRQELNGTSSSLL